MKIHCTYRCNTQSLLYCIHNMNFRARNLNSALPFEKCPRGYWIHKPPWYQCHPNRMDAGVCWQQRTTLASHCYSFFLLDRQNLVFFSGLRWTSASLGWSMHAMLILNTTFLIRKYCSFRVPFGVRGYKRGIHPRLFLYLLGIIIIIEWFQFNNLKVFWISLYS
jgi:hypothetical protein